MVHAAERALLSAAACKARVRSNWTPARWTRDFLHTRKWPARHASYADCARHGTSSSTAIVDLSQPAIFERAFDSWPDPSQWTIENLEHTFGEAECAVGDDDDDEDVAVTLSLSDYLSYARQQQDDCPLYIFDDSILDEHETLGAAYAAPPCLPEDELRSMPDRPPHRWALIGCTRTGSAPHQDPDYTAAWNTLVCGRKRWFFYPPEVAEAKVYAGAADDAVERSSAAHWLHECYPQLAHLPGVEVEQRAGETVYVPSRFWHCVVNLELSVSVTANFVHHGNAAEATAAMRARGV